jgi:hypothetical protein
MKMEICPCTNAGLAPLIEALKQANAKANMVAREIHQVCTRMYIHIARANMYPLPRSCLLALLHANQFTLVRPQQASSSRGAPHLNIERQPWTEIRIKGSRS